MKTKLLLTLLALGLLMNNISAQVIFASDFENWSGTPQLPTDWNGSKTTMTTAPYSVTQNSTSAYHGSFCAKLKDTTTTAKRFSTQPLSITAGAVYTVRFWAKGAGSIRTGLYGVKQSTGFGYAYAPSYVTVTSTWTAYTQTITSDSTNSAAQFILAAKSTISASGNIDVDSVTITNTGVAQNATLYAIQYTTTAPYDSPLNNMTVNTGGIVTGVYNNSATPPTQSGYYIQSTGFGAWAGVNVYDFSHPVAVGDSVTFTAMVTEYYNETELTAVTNFVKVSSGHTLPTPTVVDFTTIQNEKYEGLLVKVNNVTCLHYNSGSAWYAFKDDQIPTAAEDTVDNIFYTYSYTVGKKYNLTGLIHFEYQNWLEPRSQADVDSINVTAGIQDFKNNFTNVTVYPNPNNGEFTLSIGSSKSENNTTIILTDLTGRVLYRELHPINTGINTMNLTIPNLAKGIYLMEISNEQSKAVQKITIQ